MERENHSKKNKKKQRNGLNIKYRQAYHRSVRAERSSEKVKQIKRWSKTAQDLRGFVNK